MASAFICEECPRKLECIVCGAPFLYHKAGKGRLPRFCSQTCRVTRGRRELYTKTCSTCGRAFKPARVASGVRPQVHCSLRCRPQSERTYSSPVEQKRAEGHRRRARKQAAGYERFDAQEIFQRDGWRCGLCRKTVNPALAFPHHMSASLDHIVPLSEGGKHTRANSQCAHWICNSRKSNGSGGQLRLFG